MNNLLQKYNIPVPRYTSYPPANYFDEAFTAAKYYQAIEESNQWQPENISFYFHIPFCKKMCYFCGCNSYALRKERSVHAYMEALKTELKRVIGMLDKNRKVAQIHYGGGTPNAVEEHYLQEINEIILSNFEMIDDPEIAIECNPAYLDEKQIEGLKKAGFNRFSLGIQDFDKQVLDAVNREEPFMELGRIMELLRNDRPDIKINLDFIYGLPKQTAEGFAETISRAAALRPDRLVTFSYAHVPWVSKIQKKLEAHGLPAQDEKVRMNQRALEVMQQNGYVAIGMDHYATPDDELYSASKNHQLHRNFQGYCTLRTTGQVYAFGVTGISQLEQIYAQNTKSIDEYIKLINEGKFTTIKGYRLTNDQVIVREAITGLMCNQRIVWSELADRLKIDIEQIKQALANRPGEMEELEKDGIVENTLDMLKVTPEGALFLRNVAAALDPLTGTVGKSFSKPV